MQHKKEIKLKEKCGLTDSEKQCSNLRKSNAEYNLFVFKVDWGEEEKSWKLTSQVTA